MAQDTPRDEHDEPADGDAPAPPAPEPAASEPTPPAAPVAPDSVADESAPPAQSTATEGPAGSDETAADRSGSDEPAPEQAAGQEGSPAAGEQAAGQEGSPAAGQEGDAAAGQEGSAATQEGVPGGQQGPATAAEEDDEADPSTRAKPAVPGADLEVDIVPEGVDPLALGGEEDPYAVDEEPRVTTEDGEEVAQPIATAAIDLGAGARSRATGQRQTAIARVILRPGNGVYLVNGHPLDVHFPRVTLQRNIRQPLETVGYDSRMDVVARLQGGGISAQAGALRHGISRALLEADPNLRGELKRRGFLTRDSRAKERKKAGLKKARKRPQFSKR